MFEILNFLVVVVDVLVAINNLVSDFVQSFEAVLRGLHNIVSYFHLSLLELEDIVDEPVGILLRCLLVLVLLGCKVFVFMNPCKKEFGFITVCKLSHASLLVSRQNSIEHQPCVKCIVPILSSYV